MKDELILGIVASVVAMLIYDKIKSDAVALGTAVNPADPGNEVNTWFNTVYEQVTGSDQVLGQDVYDWLHGGE